MTHASVEGVFMKKGTQKLLSAAPSILIILSVCIAVFIGVNFHGQRQTLKDLVSKSFLLKVENLRERVEDYFHAVGTLPTYVSKHKDVIEMNREAEDFIGLIYEEHYEKHRLSEIYVIKRDFDGTRRPFMTYEHDEHEGEEMTHDEESEEEEYATQIEHINDFVKDPTLHALVSRPLELCIDEEGLVYSVPVRNGSELVGIVSGMVPLDNLATVLESSDFGLSSLLINENAVSVHCDDFDENAHSWAEKNLIIENVKHYVAKGKPFQLDGYVCMLMKLDIDDGKRWYLATLQPIQDQLISHGLINPSLGYIIAAMSLATGFILAFLCRLLKKKLVAEEREKLANAAKGMFLANISHEIRTPMNTIIGFGGLLDNTGLTDAQNGYVRTIRDNAKHLLELINDVLDLSKIESGKFHADSVKCSLGELLESIRSLMELKVTEKGLKFEIVCAEDLPEQIRTDPGRLRQCLINLVGNSIKFTESGHIYIRVSRVTMNKKRFIRFNVEDSGIGIPSDKQQVIFQSFLQADTSTTSKYGGSGLGLSITKQLTEVMGGKLTLISAEGHGTSISLMIPDVIDEAK